MIKALGPQQLRWICDPAQFTFTSTSDISETFESLGQGRAEEALQYGIDVTKDGHHIYAMSDSGDNRRTTVEKILEARAKSRPVPQDWCYINNFENPGKPDALALPAGRARRLKREIDQFVNELPGVISSTFESEEYRAGLEKIQAEFKKQHEGALQQLGDEAIQSGLALVQGPQGFVFVPAKNGEVISPEEFAKIPEDEQKALGEKTEVFAEKFTKLSHQFPKWRRDLQTRIREMNRETMRLAAGHMIDEIRDGYKDLPEVMAFLDKVFEEVIKIGENLGSRKHGEEDQGDGNAGGITGLKRFEINVIVDQSDLKQAPVIYEDSPNYQNLLGRSDQIAYYGVLMTNFTLIKPGSLHRANGGFLLIDAEKLLTQPFAYEGLKRALKARRLKIESPLQLGGLTSTVSLDPEPIPLDIKIVLLGDRRIYYLLLELDSEFKELFKVVADFEGAILRRDDIVRQYPGFITHLARQRQLKPFTRSAVARIIEQGARASDDAEKLSVNADVISELMIEADHIAAAAGKQQVDKEHIEAALNAQIRRADRVQLLLEHEVMRETLMIATQGEEVGQINGLAVIQAADYAFAHPMRITANVWLGKGNIIDIEREAELGGKIHSKGVMILSSYLAWKFGATRPLAIGASLVFEQSYGPVEGDSASLAELLALLSALANVPITQALAVTGSVNQHGRVQAIGGVNEKIEGFYDLCKARGLTGKEGVLIPQANVKHLMLRGDVVEACTSKKFHIYAAASVDEAIGLMTGKEAGASKDGVKYPPGTVHYLITEKISAMARAAKEGSATAKGKKKKN